MVVASYALANICAGHSELETLTVALATARAFASAAFAMLLLSTIIDRHQLLDESLRVALHYLGLGRLYDGLPPRQVVAILAAALLGVAVVAPRETLAVELEALGPAALALSGQGHWLQQQWLGWFVHLLIAFKLEGQLLFGFFP